jgi:hypothetical protein
MPVACGKSLASCRWSQAERPCLCGCVCVAVAVPVSRLSLLMSSRNMQFTVLPQLMRLSALLSIVPVPLQSDHLQGGELLLSQNEVPTEN